MLFHVTFLGELVKFAEHASVMHIMSVNHHAAVGKIPGTSIVNVNAARCQVFLLVGLKQILLIVTAAEQRVADVCVLYIYPAYYITVNLKQGVKIHLGHPRTI